MAPFKVTRYAAGKLHTPPKAIKEFPVVVTTALLAYQVKKDRKWETICTLNSDAAAKVRKHMDTRGRKFGKDYRTAVAK